MEPTPAPPDALGARLLRRGLISEADLGFVLQWQRSLNREWPVHRLGSLLVKAGLLPPRQVADALAEQRRVTTVTELPRQVPPLLQQVLPQELLRRHEAAPLYVAGSTLVLGMTDPDRAAVVAELQALTRYALQPVLVLQIQVQRLLRSMYAGGLPARLSS